jgi:hypothetical protein
MIKRHLAIALVSIALVTQISCNDDTDSFNDKGIILISPKSGDFKDVIFDKNDTIKITWVYEGEEPVLYAKFTLKGTSFNGMDASKNRFWGVQEAFPVTNYATNTTAFALSSLGWKSPYEEGQKISIEAKAVTANHIVKYTIDLN